MSFLPHSFFFFEVVPCAYVLRACLNNYHVPTRICIFLEGPTGTDRIFIFLNLVFFIENSLKQTLQICDIGSVKL